MFSAQCKRGVDHARLSGLFRGAKAGEYGSKVERVLDKPCGKCSGVELFFPKIINRGFKLGLITKESID